MPAISAICTRLVAKLYRALGPDIKGLIRETEMDGRVSWVNLHQHIAQKDVRRLIYALLDVCDRFCVMQAHGIASYFDRGVQNKCAEMGYVILFNHLVNENCDPWTAHEASNHAARAGQLEMLKFIRAHFKESPFRFTTCAHAAQSGRLEVIEWLREQGCAWDDETCTWAIRCGHYHVFKWAIAKGCNWIGKEDDDLTYSALEAIEWNQLRVLQQLIEDGAELSSSLYEAAIVSNYLPIVQWLHTVQCPWTVVHEVGCERRLCLCGPSLVEFARSQKRHEIVAWLTANACVELRVDY